MIFVTVGSHPTYAFQRLMDALHVLPLHDLIVQHGPASPPKGVAESHQWLSFVEVREYMTKASAVVSHAGAGTILCASNLGQTPIVVPRLRKFGETVDDHQVDLARVLERTGRVLVAWDATTLPELICRASLRPNGESLERRRLIQAVHASLREAKR